MKYTDVLFIHPSDRYDSYQALGKELTTVEPPVWCGMLAEYIRRKGWVAQILDMDALETPVSALTEFIDYVSPMLVVIVVHGHHPSASTQNMPATRKILEQIEHLPYPTLLVGGHVSALPRLTMEQEKCTYVCDGEGMRTIEALLQVDKTNHLKLEKVPDLWYRHNDIIYRSEARGRFLDSLEEEMPTLAWDLLPMDKYRTATWHTGYKGNRYQYAAIYSSLSCPYTCHFCMISQIFKSGEAEKGMPANVNSYRMWNAKHVVDVIEHLVVNYGITNLKFADEMFVLNPRHVEGICNGITERGLDLNIWGYARVDTTKPKWLDMLKKAGFSYLGYGIEAASEQVRNDIDKGYEQNDIFTCLDATRKAGINIGANYIFGLPEDNIQTMQETYDLACKINAEYSNFYIAQRYPGSALFSEAYPNVSLDWTHYSQLGKRTRSEGTRYISGAEVLRFRDKAFMDYSNRSEYKALVRQKFGDAALHNIRDMLSVKLEREFA